MINFDHMKPTINIKRAYEKPAKTDGLRILVDRLWPRGIPKAAAAIDDWIKDLAPTTELRKWFGHDPALWAQFQKKYQVELKNNEAIAPFVEKYRDSPQISLIYAGKDEEHTHAIVLREYLKKAFDKK
jgi:uncharacterized protein YeaO (DUF488 family)